MNKNENEQNVSQAAAEEAKHAPNDSKLAEMLEALGHTVQEPILATRNALDAMNDYEFEMYLSILANELPARKQARDPLSIVRKKIRVIMSQKSMCEIEREDMISELLEKFMETDKYYKGRVKHARRFLEKFEVMHAGEKITPS